MSRGRAHYVDVLVFYIDSFKNYLLFRLIEKTSSLVDIYRIMIIVFPNLNVNGYRISKVDTNTSITSQI